MQGRQYKANASANSFVRKIEVGDGKNKILEGRRIKTTSCDYGKKTTPRKTVVAE